VKNEKNILKILWILSFIPLLITIVFYNRLPEKVPMHWNIRGQIDAYYPKFPGAFIIPVMGLFITFLLQFLPKLDPRKENYSKFKKQYSVFMFVMIAFFIVIQLIIIGVSMGADFIRVDAIIKLFLGIMILIFGNFMPKLKHNYLMGIRTPWTLSSEPVWYKAHRHGGVVWFVTGIILIILAFIPGGISAAAYFSLIVIASIEPLIYSYLCYRKEIQERH
jgi:uncharacterized membrane protein